MPALSVSIDGNTIATVCTDGYDVLSVRVSGTRVDEYLADLEVAGGSYPEEGESIYLTWISALPLQLGQLVIVSFLENAASSHPGKAIDELFPDEKPTDVNDFKPTAEIFNDLRTMPILRDKFSFRFVSSLGTSFAGETTSEEHGFGFTVLWNSWHPERASVSLHSYTIDNLEARGPMNNHVKEHIQYGGAVHFELVASQEIHRKPA